MGTTTQDRRRREGLTLEKAVGIAFLLHVLLGAIVTWWPGLLLPAEAVAATPPAPLEFRFVDTPDPETPVETPDTEVLSDIDRRLADQSERDDQPTPLSEGNTPQNVLRLPQQASPEQRAAEATPETATAQPSEPEPDPEEEPVEEPEPERETGELPKKATDTTESSPTTTPPAPRPQPRTRDLQGALAQLETLVDPQVLDNRGGAPDSGSLAQFDTRGYDLGPYLRLVLNKVERNWRASMPPLIQTGMGGATFIALSIRRQRLPDGTEVAVIVGERTWSSGQPAYDSAAQFSLELSNPLPPIPEFFPYDNIQGRLGYIYNLDPQQVEFPPQ